MIGIGWKIFKGTSFHKSKDVDLFSGLDFFGRLDGALPARARAAPVTVKDKTRRRSSARGFYLFKYLDFVGCE